MEERPLGRPDWIPATALALAVVCAVAAIALIRRVAPVASGEIRAEPWSTAAPLPSAPTRPEPSLLDPASGRAQGRAQGGAADTAPRDPSPLAMELKHDDAMPWPASFHPSPERPSFLTMCLKDDRALGDAICPEGGEASWPSSFHPTPERPTPLTMCLKPDGASGDVICPGSGPRLSMRLR